MRSLTKSLAKFSISFLMVVFAVSSEAQPGRLYNADNSLSSSFTNCVYIDRDGFVWIGTRNGLNRYDGYDFRVFRKGEPGCAGMSGNHVNSIVQANDKTFYLGMFSGVQSYYDDRFHDVILRDIDGTEVKDYVNTIMERRNGDILIGTSVHGIFRLESREEAVPFDKDMGIQSAWRIFEDAAGVLWVVTGSQGVAEIKDSNVKFHFTDKGMSAAVKSVCEDDKGNLYFATAGHGMYVRKSGEDEPLQEPITAGRYINEVFYRKEGKILLGFDGEGVAVYDPVTRTLLDNPIQSYEIELSHTKVQSLAEDAYGNVWIGLIQKGVYMQPKMNTEFQSMGLRTGNNNVIGDFCIQATYKDSRGDVWVGTDRDGVYWLDSQMRLKRHFKGNIPSTIFGIAEDDKGRIWVSSFDDGAGYIDKEKSSYHKITAKGLERYQAFAIKADDTGNIWIATMGNGLMRYNSKTDEIKVYKATGEAYGDGNVNGLTNDYISQLDVVPDGSRVYLATTMGVSCYDVTADSWTTTFGTNVLSQGIAIHCVKTIGDSCLWYGTMDGLCCYNIAKKETKTYTTKSGLTDNSISAIQPDGIGNLWVSTLHGLNRIDIRSGAITGKYHIDDGLQGNEFSDGASALGKDGIVLFGGLGGITWFNPSSLNVDAWNPNLRLTDFLLGGDRVSAGDKSGRYVITNSTVDENSFFELSPNDNTFTLKFSTLTYDSPYNITYSYSINGEEWTELQAGVNEISLGKVAPGTYKFNVKATKNGMDSQVKEFTVKIHYPWYRTIWAYIVYVLIIVAIVVYYFRQRKAKEQASLRLQEHIHAEEMGEAKIRFFINISHEIRTPMTLILSPLMELIKEDNDHHRQGLYETIKRNAERILHLINQLMDLRKIEKGKMAMHMVETDIVGFTKEVYNLFEYKARLKNIHFSFLSDADTLNVWIDRANFDKILINLLSNAFKYTPSGGRISINVGNEEGMLRIDVKDNGEGIPADKLGRIFDRFYQGVNKANQFNFGTGIGLDLTRSLVELHHGTITAVNNADGDGCCFTVKMPMGKDHLSEKELEPIPDNEAAIFEQLMEPTYSQLAGASQPVAQGSAKKGETVVAVIEDDVEILHYLKEELQPVYTVKTFDRANEALSDLLSHPVDLVITDIMMPGMDGMTLCAKLKSNPNTNSIPIILLTAKTLEQEQLEGLQTGADAYITKPFNMEILRRTMTNLISARDLLRKKYSVSTKISEQMDDVVMQSPDEKLLRRIMKVINDNLGDSEMSVDFIAKEVGLSRVHLYRKMKELTSQSPHEFIRTLRLRQAAKLLSNPHHSITEVMYACGFSNSASFSTAFKSLYGRSPRDYQKQMQNIT